MGTILAGALKLIGWQKLLEYAWRIAKPELELLAKKSETQFDDDCVKVVDEIISKILSDGHI